MEIIAETAFSHEGDFNYLKEQILIAKKGKADFVKFQVFLSPNDYYVSNHPALQIIGKYIFTKKEWKEAFELAQAYGLKILVLPLEIKALQFCLYHNNIIDGIEVHSVCFNDRILLSELFNYKGLIFIGIGGRTSDEIKRLLMNLNRNNDEIVLQYGFQAFPTNPFEVNLNRLADYKRQFNCHLGYADHTDYSEDIYIELCRVALSIGCRYFEKHIVINKGTKRIDYESAVSASDIKELRNKLYITQKLLGQLDIDTLTESEINYKNREKVLVAKRNLKQGHIISIDDIIYRINCMDNPDYITDYKNLIDKKLVVNIDFEKPFTSKHI